MSLARIHAEDEPDSRRVEFTGPWKMKQLLEGISWERPMVGGWKLMFFVWDDSLAKQRTYLARGD